jgi:hypothetical protein
MTANQPRATSTRTPNTSAADVLPDDQLEHVVDDAIYGQPSGNVVRSRSQRRDDEARMQRRLTPEEFEKQKARIEAQRADAEKRTAERNASRAQ